eukprot:4037955-Pyramimonas_sp.AAC.1
MPESISWNFLTDNIPMARGKVTLGITTNNMLYLVEAGPANLHAIQHRRGRAQEEVASLERRALDVESEVGAENPERDSMTFRQACRSAALANHRTPRMFRECALAICHRLQLSGVGPEMTQHVEVFWQALSGDLAAN